MGILFIFFMFLLFDEVLYVLKQRSIIILQKLTSILHKKRFKAINLVVIHI